MSGDVHAELRELLAELRELRSDLATLTERVEAQERRLGLRPIDEESRS